MTLALFSIIAWSFICAFSLIPKQLGFVENTIILFILIICATMSATTLSLNMHLFQISDKLHLFFCFWLSRSIILPLVTLGGINLFLRPGSLWWKLLTPVFALSIAIIFGEWILRATGIMTVTGWNYFYFACLFSFIFLMNLALTLLLRKIERKHGADAYDNL